MGLRSFESKTLKQKKLCFFTLPNIPRNPHTLHKDVGTGNKSSKVHSLDGQGKGFNLLFVFDWQDSCVLPLVVRLRPTDEREVVWSTFSASSVSGILHD